MLAVGYFSVVILMGWSKGMVAELIGNGTGILTGQLQVHAADYQPDIGGREGTDVAALVNAVRADPAIEAATPRVYGGGLVSTGSATAAAMFLGVDPELEPQVSRIMRALDRGRHPHRGANELLIGAEMARSLGAEPGDTVVVVAPAVDGSLGNDLFVVSGIYSTGLADLDRAFALVPIDALQFLMALEPTRIHEIAASVPDPWRAAEAAERLSSVLGGTGFAVGVESWATLRPEMVEYAQLSKAFQWILLFVVFGMAIFGVANTMLMATFERRYEFALLLALGATPGVIVRSVLWEAIALGALALAAGAAITFPVMVWWHLVPLDLSWLFGDFTMLGALMRPVIRIEYPWLMTVQAAVALFLTAALAALYPAIGAARLPPADTMAGR